MKKRFFSALFVLALVLSLFTGCTLFDKASDNDENIVEENDAVTLLFCDITLDLGGTAQLVSSVTIGERIVKIDYSFDGNNISIEDGKLTALVEKTVTTVTARAEGYTATFKVEVLESEPIEAPNVEIGIEFDDVTLKPGEELMLLKSITVGDEEKTLAYSFSGDAISISNYKLTALKHNTVTTVTAKADGFETSFDVTVGGDTGTMTIDAPKSIYTNYAPKKISVSFSDPAYASDVTYTASDSRVSFKDGGIYATGSFSAATNVTVTARSDYHTETFTVKVSEFSLNNDESAVRYYEENIIKPENKGGTIFIGDSYFSGQLKNGKPSFWSDFYEDYTDGKHFLMGISGSQIVNWEVVAERIVYPMEPKEIVLHIGFNDIHSSDRSAYEIASRIIAMLEEFREKIPDTKIYYCSVEPKKNALDPGSSYYEKSMVFAPMINTMIEAYTYENKNVKFVDTRSFFFNEDGTINKSLYLSTDLSHPTLEAYDLYRQAIERARGNAFSELTPSEALEQITANQSAVNSAAAESKLISTVYTIENNPRENAGQTLAKYFTDADGNALANYYSISGYMEVSDLEDNGSHVQFRFSNTTNDRFLLYDSNSNKKLGLCAPFEGKSNEASSGTVADALDASGGSAILKWQIIVTENVAYFYVNDVPVLYGKPSALNYFNISVEKADICFFGVELVVKSENLDAYNAILAEKKIM